MGGAFSEPRDGEGKGEGENDKSSEPRSFVRAMNPFCSRSNRTFISFCDDLVSSTTSSSHGSSKNAAFRCFEELPSLLTTSGTREIFSLCFLLSVPFLRLFYYFTETLLI